MVRHQTGDKQLPEPMMTFYVDYAISRSHVWVTHVVSFVINVIYAFIIVVPYVISYIYIYDFGMQYHEIHLYP